VKIALLEDDMLQAELMLGWLSGSKHECVHFATGAEFRLGVRKQVFGLAILDWLLPDDDGVEVLAWLRKNVSAKLPAMMVTSRDAKEDIVRALDAGADDYLAKPVDRAELLARVRVLGRHADALPPEAPIDCRGIALDRAERTASVRGAGVVLTDKEFELAACLLANPGRLFTRQALAKQVWGRETDTVSRSLDTHVSRLRAKLGLTPEHGFNLASIYGKGYRLELRR
jgi:DNA-binding response OmpR family regulator